MCQAIVFVDFLTLDMSQCPRCGHMMRLAEPNQIVMIRFSTGKRKKIWAKTGYRCYYCGVTPPGHEMTVDHYIPQSRGGHSNMKNLVPSCATCNNKKASLTIEAFRIDQQKRSMNLPKNHPFRQNGYRFAFEVYGWRK